MDTTARDQYNPNTDPIQQNINKCQEMGENYHFNFTNGQCEEWENIPSSGECPCPEGQNECMIDQIYYVCEEEVCPCPEGQILCEIDNVLYDCADYQ